MTKPCPPCPVDKVCNPASGKCVLRTGRTGKKVLANRKNTRTNTDNNNSNTVNMITQERIPHGRKFVLRGAVYDVHGLADLLQHDDHGTVTNFGRRASRVPHIPSEAITAAEKAAIYARARNTVPEWTPEARAAAAASSTASVPPELAAAAATARAARNAMMARQRAGMTHTLSYNQTNAIWGAMADFERWIQAVGAAYDALLVSQAGERLRKSQKRAFSRLAIDMVSQYPGLQLHQTYTVGNDRMVIFKAPALEDPKFLLRIELDRNMVSVITISLGNHDLLPIGDSRLSYFGDHRMNAKFFSWGDVTSANYELDDELPEDNLSRWSYRMFGPALRRFGGELPVPNYTN